MFEKIIAWLKGKKVEELTDAERLEFQALLKSEPEVPGKSTSTPDSIFTADDAALLRQMAKDLAETKELNRRQQEEIDGAKKVQTKEKIDSAIQKAIDEQRVGAQDELTKKEIRGLFELDFKKGEFFLSQLPKLSSDSGKAPADKKPESGKTPDASGKVQRNDLVEAARQALKTANEGV